jgi:hypothetical protein
MFARRMVPNSEGGPQEPRGSRSGLRPGVLIREGLGGALGRPFRVLAGLSLFASFVSVGVTERADAGSLLIALALEVVAAYVQIACTLAAASTSPTPSADAWFRAALRRRCFWRFVLTGLIALLSVALGMLAFIIGAFVVGSAVALAQPAAVLEGTGPIQSLRRSAALGSANRGALAIVFGVFVVVPVLAAQSAYALEVPARPLLRWLVVTAPVVLLTLAGTIALTRAFSALGGTPAPAPEQTLPVAHP